ncbi:hypothetical protein AVEN_98896-1 [Araneus ventricosus]|uniref:Uncharacterized protein n=1 Tax=Araneus ventricosus TaxID=182803 RepID=A0A4Y2FU53_ARAVE|nr:hypothetical protein AVEN_98896-1 [Araneus ventricosus]
MGHILNSLSSPYEYEDIVYKQCETKNTIINQDSSLTPQIRTVFPSVAQACDNASVSERSAEILINVALNDMGIINIDDSSKVVDRSKFRRKRIKTQSDLKRENDGKHSLS